MPSLQAPDLSNVRCNMPALLATPAAPRAAAQLASVLNFLMQLGFRQIGQPYPLSGLGPLEQRIAAHMAQLGLLFTFKAEGGMYYCPTALAASLSGSGVGIGAAAALGANALAASSTSGGYVIVETNFRVSLPEGGGSLARRSCAPRLPDGGVGTIRLCTPARDAHTNVRPLLCATRAQVYAYTSSRIQVRVLEEFCRLDCALPNLFVGTLTRDSVQRALAKGLSANDIIGFLQGHAHPQVAARVPSVPEVRAHPGGRLGWRAVTAMPWTQLPCTRCRGCAMACQHARSARVRARTHTQTYTQCLPPPPPCALADGAGSDPPVGEGDAARDHGAGRVVHGIRGPGAV